MLRMSKFNMGIFFELRIFWPIKNGKNTCKNFFLRILKCRNLSWEFFLVLSIQNGQNTYIKFSIGKFFQKYSECRKLSWEFFCGYACFGHTKWLKHLWKILRQKFFSKILSMSKFNMRIFFELRIFWPKQNGQNTCK